MNLKKLLTLARKAHKNPTLLPHHIPFVPEQLKKQRRHYQVCIGWLEEGDFSPNTQGSAVSTIQDFEAVIAKIEDYLEMYASFKGKDVSCQLKEEKKHYQTCVKWLEEGGFSDAEVNASTIRNLKAVIAKIEKSLRVYAGGGIGGLSMVDFGRKEGSNR